VSWKKKKVYGESKVNSCPFCDKAAMVKNPQKIPVCNDHKKQMLSEIECVCGSYLEIRQGKFGSFFTCINCGALNFRKGLEMLQMMKLKKKKEVNVSREERVKEAKSELSPQAKHPVLSREPYKEKEVTVVRSDELDFMY
jgi:hypothetical protein